MIGCVSQIWITWLTRPWRGGSMHLPIVHCGVRLRLPACVARQVSSTTALHVSSAIGLHSSLRSPPCRCRSAVPLPGSVHSPSGWHAGPHTPVRCEFASLVPLASAADVVRHSLPKRLDLPTTRPFAPQVSRPIQNSSKWPIGNSPAQMFDRMAQASFCRSVSSLKTPALRFSRSR